MDEYGQFELSTRAEKNRKKIQSLIISCVDCQPFDEGEAVWIHGERWELTELFEEHNVPENQWEAIASNLRCPECGSECIETFSDVGIKSKYDIALDKYIKQTLKKYKPLIDEFDALIEKTPLLAFSHKFGKRLFDDLKKSELPITEIEGTYFRAREVKNSDIMSKEKMMHPPIGKPQEGRYNHSGQSHLYLSRDWKTAIEEVIGGNEDKIAWTIELNIGKVDKILDLSFDWTQTTPETSPVYLALCGQNYVNRFDRNDELWKPDYFLTRFIMDCAKILGYNGIRYHSTKTSYIENVVLFYPENCLLQANKEPELRKYLKKESSRWEPIDL